MPKGRTETPEIELLEAACVLLGNDDIAVADSDDPLQEGERVGWVRLQSPAAYPEIRHLPDRPSWSVPIALAKVLAALPTSKLRDFLFEFERRLSEWAGPWRPQPGLLTERQLELGGVAFYQWHMVPLANNHWLPVTGLAQEVFVELVTEWNASFGSHKHLGYQFALTPDRVRILYFRIFREPMPEDLLGCAAA